MPSTASRLGAVRRLPRDPVRFYEISDLATARKVGGLLWLFAGLIIAVLLPVSPPDQEVGRTTAWLIGAGVVAVCLIAALPLLRTPERVTNDALLSMGYASLALIVLLQWAGGPHSPYSELFIISVIYVAAVHPPRRVLLFMAAVAMCLALPLVYEGWNNDYAAQGLAHMLLWSSLAAVTVVFTAEVRGDRLELLEDEQQASELARRDPLTGLGNRRAFDEALARVVGGVRRADRPLTLVIADIDGFKAVNDRYGHLEGDRCLRSVARAIAGSVRPSDDSFRWGGDEFAVLLPSTEYEQARVVVNRIADAIASDVEPPGDEPVSLRYGVAEIAPGMDADALVEAADMELLAAKSRVQEPAQ